MDTRFLLLGAAGLGLMKMLEARQRGSDQFGHAGVFGALEAGLGQFQTENPLLAEAARQAQRMAATAAQRATKHKLDRYRQAKVGFIQEAIPVPDSNPSVRDAEFTIIKDEDSEDPL